MCRNLLFCSILFFACSADDSNSVPQINLGLQAAVDGCEVFYSFELMTASYIEPASPGMEATELVEQVLGLPSYGNCVIEACLNSDGTISANIDILAVPEEYHLELPEGTVKADTPVGEDLLPSRIAINHGAITIFDSNDKPISETYSKLNAEFVSLLIKNLQKNNKGAGRKITKNEEEAMFKAFKENDFEVIQGDSRFAMIGLEHTDGTTSHTIYDRRLQIWRGQVELDVDGELISRTTLFFDENDDNLPLTGQETIVYFESPSSGNRFVKRSTSKISNFKVEQ